MPAKMPRVTFAIVGKAASSSPKEVLKADNLTIGHIMPQTLTKAWSEHIAPEEHQRYLHTLGNLSVTGYNSELSNKSFAEKKRITKRVFQGSSAK